ncbi:MAG TPA: phosphoglycerate dehydrogenase [Anaerolineaceae bacterium]|nr:phosphoglycerate dehydrogenase [Anaerolineaceae bacterium]
MPVLLLSAPYMLPFVNRFKPVFDHYQLELLLAQVNERLGEEALLSLAGQFDGIICGDDRFTPRVLEACSPRLKVISKWGTGTDSIDRAACERLGIQLKNTPNAFTIPVADSVLGYILAFARRQPWMDRAMKSGKWQKIPGRALSETTLGVVGVGNIGKAVLKRASAFGMRLLGNDIIPIPADFLQEYHVESVSLPELVSQADFISLNCDLNPTSRHLIHKDIIRLMKPDAVLINTARGPVVNEKDLIEALQQKRIAGAGLDVFEEEPLPADSALLHMENVLLAPHNSNSSPRAWENVHWNSIRNLLIGLAINAEDLDEWKSKV